jgi:antitoxin MazE
LPKAVIEQCGFGEKVDLCVEGDRVIIAPHRRPREGWEEALKAAGSSKNDELLLDCIDDSQFDREEWKW